MKLDDLFFDEEGYEILVESCTECEGLFLESSNPDINRINYCPCCSHPITSYSKKESEET